jgi:hypothetical protein
MLQPIPLLDKVRNLNLLRLNTYDASIPTPPLRHHHHKRQTSHSARRKLSDALAVQIVALMLLAKPYQHLRPNSDHLIRASQATACIRQPTS